MMRRKKRDILEKILSKFSKIRILVIGDIMMDRYILGRVSRISPEAPVPVILVEKEDFNLGGAANVAHNIYALGGKVSLCGLVGDDENGRKVKKRLLEVGIENSGVFMEQGRQTTVKTRIIAHHPHHQQLVRIDRETTDHPKRKTLLQIQEFLKKNLGYFDGIIISDYGKGLLTKKLIHTVIQGS
ncbi:MAG: bifunctional heptose 7-phosphate kinase/heptose 1-phosphate adenyltransferase, partial [Thermodesulfobacteriota bacterium]